MWGAAYRGGFCSGGTGDSAYSRNSPARTKRARSCNNRRRLGAEDAALGERAAGRGILTVAPLGDVLADDGVGHGERAEFGEQPAAEGTAGLAVRSGAAGRRVAGRLQVSEVDRAALLDRDRAGFITGANFIVDGGMTRKMIYEE